ncbi:hypothetical protein FRC02_002304 [Tulasnella sp. 418]|nr:hypothetical protein FRC02_002304 [Tulasnella sp. 418]
MVFNEPLPAPPRAYRSQLEGRHPKVLLRSTVSHLLDRHDANYCVFDRNGQFLQTKKREAISFCANPKHFLPAIPRKEKTANFKLAKTAIKDKFFSKQFSDKPFSKNHSYKMAELGEISTLPTLERFSTSLGVLRSSEKVFGWMNSPMVDAGAFQENLSACQPFLQ